MREVTIYRHEDGKARMIPWSDRDNPPESEVFPEGYEKILYTIMPTDWVEYVKNKTEDEVNIIISGFIP